MTTAIPRFFFRNGNRCWSLDSQLGGAVAWDGALLYCWSDMVVKIPKEGNQLKLSLGSGADPLRQPKMLLFVCSRMLVYVPCQECFNIL